MSKLYIKDNYLNKTINVISNKSIIEYDLKSANTSLCREYELLDNDTILKIDRKNKKERNVAIGKIMKKDPVFKLGLKNAFIDIRKRFFELNSVSDEDILSIKKDAIFCLRNMDHTKIGQCLFVSKNKYTSYLYLNNIEFYYANTLMKSILDIKNINDKVLVKHEDYMLDFFKILFSHIESGNQRVLLQYLKRFISKYKSLQLPVGYYREFNNNSILRLIDSDETYDNDVFIPYDHKQEHLNIDYNFFNILLPLLQILI